MLRGQAVPFASIRDIFERNNAETYRAINEFRENDPAVFEEITRKINNDFKQFRSGRDKSKELIEYLASASMITNASFLRCLDLSVANDLDAGASSAGPLDRNSKRFLSARDRAMTVPVRYVHGAP